MDLVHLKHNSCPCCRSRVVAVRADQQHSNGEWFELMEFECGCRIRYVPNFSREETQQGCPNTVKAKERQSKRTVARARLRRYISLLDVDDEFKAQVACYGLGAE